MSALSDLLTEANKQGWSSRQVADEARRHGHRLGHDTAAKYLRGDHGKPEEPTLLAFADTFRLSMTKLREAASLSPTVTKIDLPPEASRLTPRQWRAVREVILSMVNPAGHGEVEGGSVTPIRPKDTPPTGIPDRAAARRSTKRPPRGTQEQRPD